MKLALKPSSHVSMCIMVLIVLPILSDFLSLSWVTSPSTFSSMKPSTVSRCSVKTLWISKNNVPLVSAKPFCNPALLKAWQGNPPNSTLKFGMSSFVTVVMSFAVILSSGKFSFRALIAEGLISEVNTHFPLNPRSASACSNPILIPPIPANRSINVNHGYRIRCGWCGGIDGWWRDCRQRVVRVVRFCTA